MRKYLILLGLALVGLAGCGSNADTVSTNISKEAEKFHVGRRIVVVNSITDKPVYSVEGVCSFEESTRRLDVICKDGPNKYYKATIGLGDNTTFAVVQLGTINVSQYRTKIVVRPEAIIPDFDLVNGEAAK